MASPSSNSGLKRPNSPLARGEFQSESTTGLDAAAGCLGVSFGRPRSHNGNSGLEEFGFVVVVHAIAAGIESPNFSPRKNAPRFLAGPIQAISDPMHSRKDSARREHSWLASEVQVGSYAVCDFVFRNT